MPAKDRDRLKILQEVRKTIHQIKAGRDGAELERALGTGTAEAVAKV